MNTMKLATPLTSLFTLAVSATSFAPKASFLRRPMASIAGIGRGGGSSMNMSTEVSDDEYDLVVIGAGSGGVRASRISTGHGAKVAIIEGQLNHGPPNYSAVGGTCVNVSMIFVFFRQFQRRKSCLFYKFRCLK